MPEESNDKNGGGAMYKQGIGKFKYYVGIDSLAKIATREDRVCVSTSWAASRARSRP